MAEPRPVFQSCCKKGYGVHVIRSQPDKKGTEVPSGNLISITKIEKKEDQSKWGKIVFLMAYLTGNGSSEWNPQKDYWVCLEGEDGEKFF